MKHRNSFILSILTLSLLISFSSTLQAKIKIYSLFSPDKKLELQIVVDQQISYTLLRGKQTVIAPSVISMTTSEGVLGPNEKLSSDKTSSIDEVIESPFYRQSSFKNQWNQIDFKFKHNFGVQFRICDQGMAYRFYTFFKDEIEILAEEANFNFDNNYTAYLPFSEGFPNPYQTSFENAYTVSPLHSIDKDTVAFSPLMVAVASDCKVVITESDLDSYPGMFLKANGKGFTGVFAAIPSKIQVHPTRCQEKVLEYSDVLARTKGKRNFPWRIAAVVEKDSQLPVNNMVYALAAENQIGETGWIKPGKVAWDWWNNWGVTGVDFPVGINTQTYKYFIDFASTNGIEYVVLDEGWSSPKEGNMMSVIPEIDLKELIQYGESKNVHLILWCVAFTLDKKLDQACRHYAKMGIKGFKVDFIDRDDQQAVDLVHRIAAKAAEHKLLVDFHGMYKPAGLNRSYPNVINFEGVWGLEQMKWCADDMVTYDVTMPYLRMFSGPVDYTQGAVRNAIKKDFKAIYNNPMSQGTRAHQVATYVVFDSPLVMLCDNPTAYMKEQETTDFIVSIPTVWDETLILDGKIGEYIISARRSGKNWYIGVLGNWDERDLSIDLSFLGKGHYEAKLFADGKNAHRSATDYRIETRKLTHKERLEVHLAPGGGFTAVLIGK